MVRRVLEKGDRDEESPSDHGSTAVVSARTIRVDERSGVLNPANLERYGALWLDPDPAVTEVVGQYWHVRWHLDPGETIPQTNISLPAITLSIEEGDVPATFVVTGVQSRAWRRDISGRGAVFALRLTPAGFSVLSDLSPASVADATVPVTADLDERLHDLLASIASVPSPESRARAANAAIGARLRERPLSDEARLAKAVAAELTARVRSRAGGALAEQFGTSERAVQRALKQTLGHGPKWISRWIRLQEVARVLAGGEGVSAAALAVDLGYSDQAHLVNDFRLATGLTPAAYARSVTAFSGGADPD
ncbi:MAG: AraC family transcriptional regulator [Trueperaceae bacterium]|nr:AraC family transcriptional regulator [Trueperaceae bacterium]